MTDLVIVTATTPDEAVALRIAADAVRARLAACAQVQGPIHSTFQWRGAIDQATEWYCHLKTTRASLEALTALIRRAHPYQVPEIVAVPIVAGFRPYLEWVAQEVSPPPPPSVPEA